MYDSRNRPPFADSIRFLSLRGSVNHRSARQSLFEASFLSISDEKVANSYQLHTNIEVAADLKSPIILNASTREDEIEKRSCHCP